MIGASVAFLRHILREAPHLTIWWGAPGLLYRPPQRPPLHTIRVYPLFFGRRVGIALIRLGPGKEASE